MSDTFHFIGIGGIGMSGLATLLHQKNKRVTGSDLCKNYLTDKLQSTGIHVQIGHDARYISKDMTVVYNTDIKEINPEYQAALQLKCPLVHRSELLAKLMEGHLGLAVTGTHGKTTTSSLLTWVLDCAELSPSFAVGGSIGNFNSNSGMGKGEYFVVEACESDGSFLRYSPHGGIVTNIDLEHMDYYQTEDALMEAFGKFIEKIKNDQLLFWCHDDSRLRKLNIVRGIGYGFSDSCDLQATKFYQKGWKTYFDCRYKNLQLSNIELSLTGKHNVLNALSVLGMALSLGISEQKIREAFSTFKGVRRRCEFKGEMKGIEFFDDYAHHPVEIQSTLEGIRAAIGEKRLVVLYQPHRFTRTKTCLGGHRNCFKDADAIFLTEIYSAQEQPIEGVTSEVIFSEIAESYNVPSFLVHRKEAVRSLADFLTPHDVLVTLGAGDVTYLSQEVQDFLVIQKTKKISIGVISGGLSVEHKISILSSEFVTSSFNKEFYEIEQIYIDQLGNWKTHREEKTSGIPYEIIQKLNACDLLFPVLHGPLGEDGTIQGFFEMLGKAYVGCCHKSAAICMDKVVTKRLMLQQGLKTSSFLTFSRKEWRSNSSEWLKRISEELMLPVYVKPTHLGSSIGVRKVKNAPELLNAIEQAFRYDVEVLVEQEIRGRELEFAVLGNDALTVFPPGEVFASIRPYDFVGKYNEAEGTPLSPSAELTEGEKKSGMEFAKRAYQAAGCKGMARVDTFMDEQSTFWLNEINPIPGFTKQSLFPQMCRVNGLSAEKLLDYLVILGLERKRQVDRTEKVILE